MRRGPRILVYCAGGLEHAGGIGRVLGNLLEAGRAAKRPYDTKVIDTRGPYSIVVSPLFFAWSLVRTVREVASGGRVAAHVNIAQSGSTVRKIIVCRLLETLRVPYFLHLHANNYEIYFRAQPEWWKGLIRRAFAAADRIVVLGSSWRNLVVDEIAADPEKVLIIRNGVPDPGSPPARPQPPQPMILFLGNLHVWKGLHELIQALASESLRDRPWRLVCAGRGTQAPYQAAAEQAGIADRITFTGWLPRDAVQDLLRQASILALPSHLEGLSVTLIEALAHGIPTVATSVGAHPDILRDHENAILVTPKDAVSLAQGLGSLLRDKDLAERIGRNGRMLFEQCLDIAQIEVYLHHVYQDMLWNEDHSTKRPRAAGRLANESAHERVTVAVVEHQAQHQ